MKNNNEEYVFASSWGVSTRLIGAIIMVHGDDSGLRLPPSIAPTQVVIVPFFKTEDELNTIQDYINPHIKQLSDAGIRVLLDDREKMSPGFKFNEWELKGAPVRLEIGFKEIENNQITVFRRDIKEKEYISSDAVVDHVLNLLEVIQDNMFNQANDFMNSNIFTTDNYDEFKEIIANGGFVRCGWDGSDESEKKIKEETKATIRCIPFDESPSNLNCILTGQSAKHEVIFAKAY